MTDGMAQAPHAGSISKLFACVRQRTGAGYCALPMTASRPLSIRRDAFWARCLTSPKPRHERAIRTSPKLRFTRAGETGFHCSARWRARECWDGNGVRGVRLLQRHGILHDVTAFAGKRDVVEFLGIFHAVLRAELLCALANFNIHQAIDCSFVDGIEERQAQISLRQFFLRGERS